MEYPPKPRKGFFAVEIGGVEGFKNVFESKSYEKAEVEYNRAVAESVVGTMVILKDHGGILSCYLNRGDGA